MSDVVGRVSRWWWCLGLAAALSVTLAACGGSGDSGAPANPVAPPAPAAPAPPAPVGGVPLAPNATIVAAGDIGQCGRPQVEATARLIDAIPGLVLPLGDIAYPDGSARDFAECYNPSWGRHRARSRPTPGNHEYRTAGGAPYYDYFGERAGAAGLGYYSFREGDWLIVSLNSNVPADERSPQATWLRSVLAAEPAKCTLAYWHHPVFSSGPHGDNGKMRVMWGILEQAGADVVLAAHDHLYERFAPQSADGRRGPGGMRQFTVGTGGAHTSQPRTVSANSEIVGSDEGVLRLTLKPEGYDWQFVAIPGLGFADSGTAVCR